MILYYTFSNDWGRSMECYDLDMDRIIKLLSLKSYYTKFSNKPYWLPSKIEHFLIQEFLSPSYFYDYSDKPIVKYGYISAFGKYNMNKFLKLADWSFHRFYFDLKLNYEKYLEEAIIKEIIE